MYRSLVVNYHVWRQVHSKNCSMSVAWMDYKKAFNSVPHNWILEYLSLFQFPSVLVDCVRKLLIMWLTPPFLQLPHSDRVELCTVSVNFGIFQGDTLSPLLFCLTLNPLSYLLDHLDGYRVSSKLSLTHLLYMDNMHNKAGLSQLLVVVQKFSAGICMDC